MSARLTAWTLLASFASAAPATQGLPHHSAVNTVPASIPSTAASIPSWSHENITDLTGSVNGSANTQYTFTTNVQRGCYVASTVTAPNPPSIRKVEADIREECGLRNYLVASDCLTNIRIFFAMPDDDPEIPTHTAIWATYGAPSPVWPAEWGKWSQPTYHAPSLRLDTFFLIEQLTMDLIVSWTHVRLFDHRLHYRLLRVLLHEGRLVYAFFDSKWGQFAHNATTVDMITGETKQATGIWFSDPAPPETSLRNITIPSTILSSAVRNTSQVETY